ncbi:transposase [Fructilactobacillus carniphilus]|uniref:transposase n=1 Tax=Fructilactobacillus carniphilus TaxID=2940297 RepID=UPI003B84711A
MEENVTKWHEHGTNEFRNTSTNQHHSKQKWQIITDRFHVVNQAYKALNKERINVMKAYGSNTPEYRQLKRFI